MKSLLKGLVFFLIAGLLTAAPLQAATDYYWNTAPWGYVGTAGNWNPNGVPGNATDDRAFINNGGLALADAAHTFGSNPLNTALDDYALQIGGAGYQSGALQQSGGTVDSARGLYLGAGDYGYYGISGGTLAVNCAGWGAVGYDPEIHIDNESILIGNGGTAVFNQTGGTVSMSTGMGYPDYAGTRFLIGGGGAADSLVNFRGGSFVGPTYSSPGVAPDFAMVMGWAANTGNNVLNIGGNALVDLTHGGDTPTGRLLMGNGGTSNTLNLGDVKSSLGGSGGANGGGGTLVTSTISNLGGYPSVVNFHGGTLQASTSAFPFYGVSSFLQVGNAYVYSEGAVFDTHGYNVTVPTVLEDPGSTWGSLGVSDIQLGMDHGSGYIGEPIVTLYDSGGTGTGATARAIVDLDPASPNFGTITDLVVTNPGINYTGTVSAVFTGGNPAVPIDPYTVTIATSANQSGGLQKLGLGTLTLGAANTYTGLTEVKGGTLSITSAGSIAGGADVYSAAVLTGSGAVTGNVVVQPGGTVTGSLAVGGNATVGGTWAGAGVVSGVATVATGGTVDPGAVGSPYTPVGTVTFGGLNLQDGSTLHFDITSAASHDKILVGYSGVYPDPFSPASPLTVNVSYTGGATSEVTLLQAQGSYFDPDAKLNFVLAGGVQQPLDSPDGINTGYLLTATRGYEGSLKLSLNNPIPDPTWNNFSHASSPYGTATNWGPPNDVPNAGDERAMFTNNAGSGAVPITLDVSPTISSMIFSNGSGTASYTITPSGANAFSMNSSIATDWHITVLSGEHTVAAGIKMAQGTGASVIRLKDGAHLTLSGALSNLTAAPSDLNFDGGFNGTGTGVLTLAGANTYTGKTILHKGVLQVSTVGSGASANPLGQSDSADPANLVIEDGMLEYAGAAGGVLSRAFTVAGNAALKLDHDATLSAQIVGNAGTTLNVVGAGKLTFSYAGVTAPNSLTIGGGAAGKAEIAAGTLTLNDDVDQGNLWLADDAIGTLTVGGSAEVNVRTLLVGKDGGSGAGVGGAVYQTGGTVNVLGDGVNPTDLSFKGEVLGHTAYGYYQMAGGTLNMNVYARSSYNPFIIGLNAPAVFEQTGGTVNNPATSNLLIGVYGNAALNVTGGVFQTSNAALNSGLLVGNINEGMLNIGGGTASALVDTAGGSVIMARLADYGPSKGIVNLRTKGVLKTSGVFGAGLFPGEVQGTAVFNFHGGTLVGKTTTGAFMEGLNEVNIYSEGAIIEAPAGANLLINQVIQEPAYSGIAKIDVVGGGGSGYIGPPVVTISGGSGSNATAVAVMNGDQVDHFVITNPGSGYQIGDNLTVTLSGGGYSTPAVGSIGISAGYFAANVAGAGTLRKVGAGTLTLAGWNTYTGLTSVEEGTLKLANGANIAGNVDVLSGAVFGSSINGGIIAGTLTLQENVRLNFDNDGYSAMTVSVSAKPTVNGPHIVDYLPSDLTGTSYPLTIFSWPSSAGTLPAGSLIPAKDSMGKCSYRLDLSQAGLADILFTPITNEWNGPSGDYFVAGNWYNPAGTAYVPQGDQQALFGVLATADPTNVNVNAPLSISSLIFENDIVPYHLGGSAIVVTSSVAERTMITVLSSPTAGHTINNNLTLNNPTEVRVSGALTLSGAIGGLAPELYGDRITLAGQNTYSGVTHDNAYLLTLSSPTGQAIPGDLVMNAPAGGVIMGAADQFGAASRITFVEGNLILNGYDQTVAGISSAEGAVINTIENSNMNFPGTAANSVLTVDNSAACTFTGTIRNHGGSDDPGYTLGLTKSGSAALTLTSTLTYTGPTTIEEGTLAITASNTLSGDILRGATSGTLEVGGAGTTLTAQGAVDIGAAVIGEGNTLLLDPATDSTENFIDQVTGSGTLIVSGTNTSLTSVSITIGALTIGGGVKAAAAPVPEPSTAVLLALFGLGALWTARRHKR